MNNVIKMQVSFLLLYLTIFKGLFYELVMLTSNEVIGVIFNKPLVCVENCILMCSPVKKIRQPQLI